MVEILVLSPHGDDAVQACGGTICRLVKEKHNIKFVTFSLCENPLLENEVKKSIKILGINDLVILDYKRREFGYFRQKILDKLLEIRQEINPVLVLIPSTFDTHQDHQTVTNEAKRAFKHCSILGYEEPWNNFKFSTDCYIPISEEDLKLKIKALRCYESQRGIIQTNKTILRSYFDEDFIRSWLVMRGQSVGTKYAEVFEIIRWVVPLNKVIF